MNAIKITRMANLGIGAPNTIVYTGGTGRFLGWARETEAIRVIREISG
jgi:hypothetical protein